MLISFAVANHRSILDRIELSLVGESRPTGSPRASLRVPGFDLELVPVVALLGPNGAGKSNVLDALRFMSSAVEDSQNTWRPKQPPPRTPFRKDDGPETAPSTYEVVFAVGGAVYEYAFGIGPAQIESERLDVFENGPRSRARLFERSTTDAGKVQVDVGRRLVGPRSAAIAATRPESLFLSSAAQSNHEQLTPVWLWLANWCRYEGPSDGPARSSQTNRSFLQANNRKKQRLREFLASADLGIVDVVVNEEAMPQEDISRVRRIWAAVAPDDEVNFPADDEWTLARAVFAHRGLVGSLDLDDESAGTQAWYQWAGPVIDTLDSGRVLAADELDAHLNDQLAGQIVTAFQSPKTNVMGAQILFTAQDPAVVTNAGLGRDQLWVVEKSLVGSSALIPATDFRGRREWDAGQAFRHGRYGGLPVIDTPNLRRVLAGGATDDSAS
jgi:energy-coupling factor transporter ATP-binding protein EcfA2